MISWFTSYVDVAIALGLIAVVVIMFITAQIGLLPKKALPFVAAALLGAIGISVFRAHRMSALRRDLEEREKVLEKQEKQLDEMKDQLKISEQELNQVNAEVSRQREVYKKEVLMIDAKNKEEMQKIDTLQGEELDREFDALLNRMGG